MQNTPNYDGVDASYQALRNVVTNPEFQRVLAEIQNLPPIERLQAAFTQLTPQVLAAGGIPIPAEFSITTRASERSAGPTTGTADVTATEQNMAYRPALQADTVVCVGFPPFQICWTTDLIE